MQIETEFYWGASKTPDRSHEQTGVFQKAKKKKNRRLILYVYEPILVSVGGRLKRQRIGKLDRDTPEIRTEFVDAADLTVADEVGHVVGIFLIKLRHAEAGGDPLAGGGTLVRIAGKRRPAAGHIDHLALGQNIIEILRKPDRPTVL
jgi:hypothetical protein